MLESALLALVVFAGFAVESTLGFGATVVAVALASLFMSIERVLPSFVPLNMVLSATLAFRGRKELDARLLFTRIAPAVAVGMPLGMWLFGRAPEGALKLGFGVFIILLGASELLRKGAQAERSADDGAPVPAPSAPTVAPAKELSTGAAAALLALGGVAHGAFGTGGPMVVYVMGKKLSGSKTTFRATLSLLWLVLNVLLMGSFFVAGRLGRGSVTLSVMLAPSLLVGLWVGQRLHDRISLATFRFAVFVGLVVAGAVLVLRNLSVVVG